MTNCLLLLALIVLACTAEVRMTAELQTESAFPDLFPSPEFRSDVGDGLKEIAKTCSYWYTSFKEDVPTDIAFPADPYQKDNKSCKTQAYIFRQRLSLMSKANFDAGALQVGNLLQMVDPTNFARGVVPAFMPENKRNPMQIILSNGLNGSFTSSVQAMIPQMNDVLLKNMIALNSQPIQLYLEKSSSIERYLRNIGLSSRVYEDIQIGSTNADQVRNINRKQVIVLFQKLFSAALNFTSPNGKALPSLVETVFTPSYSFDDFMQTCSYGYWRTGNLPQLVTQANYGRLLVLTYDDEPNSQRITAKIASCFVDGKLSSANCVEDSLNEIQKLTTLRYYVGGIDPAYAFQRTPGLDYYRETINWKRVFYDFQDQKSMGLLRPLSARVYNLLGKAYSQVETRYFPVRACPANPSVRIQFRQVRAECRVYLKKAGDKDFSRLLLMTQGAESVDIGSMVGWQPFDLKFVLRGKRNIKFFFQKATFDHKLKMTIRIGDRERNFDNGSPRSSSETKDFIYRVDPMREQIA